MDNKGFLPEDDRVPTPSADSLQLESYRPLSDASVASSSDRPVSSVSAHKKTPELANLHDDDKRDHALEVKHQPEVMDRAPSMAHSDDKRPHSDIASNSKDHSKDGAPEAFRYSAEKKELEALGKDDVTSVDLPPLLATKPYAGMGKEDLLRFSQTPFWNRLRMFCTMMFWLTWLALLGTVIALTLTFPQCEPPPEEPWYHSSVIYQIYVRSFYDYDGNGIGDIQGIRSRLDYLEDLNVDAILLTSFYESKTGVPADFGYEVINHTAISTDYGDMEDFMALLSDAHDKNIKVLIDFIPNYTGKDHPWFISANGSSDSATNPYWNYYTWQECPGGTPVNNWLSVYNQTMWTEEGERGTVGEEWCYLHQFLDSQPELNLRSTAVQDELEAILRFWLDKGVDGFRVDKVMHLFEDVDMRDEPNNCNGFLDYSCMDHKYTTSQDEIYSLVSKWREILDEYSEETGQTRVLLTDAMDNIEDATRYYGKYGPDGAHLPINYQLAYANETTGGRDVFQLADDWLYHTPIFGVTNWLTGSHDIARIGSQFPDWGYQNCLTLLKLTLPGTAFLYYGEEIGMENVPNIGTTMDPAGNIQEKYSRDPYRTPMQWTDDLDVGFVNNTGGNENPWLGVGPLGVNMSVEAQNDTEHSPLEFYRELVELRRSSASFSAGTFQWAFISDDVLSFYRAYDGSDRYVAVVNLGPNTSESDVSGSYYAIPGSADVVMTTKAMKVVPGDNVGLSSLELAPGEGLLVKWAYVRPDGKPKNNP